MIGLPDCHAHLDALAESGADLNAVAREWQAAGIGRVLSAGTDLESSRENLEVAWLVPSVWTCVGIAPGALADSGLGEDELAELADIAADPMVVGVGEVGLDATEAGASLEAQQAALSSLLGLARDEGYPVFVRCAAPIEALLEVFGELGARRPAAVITSFGGDADEAEAVCAEGIYVSLGAGNGRIGEDLARAIPAEQLLLNSDAGAPNGGREATPAAVAELAERVADVLGVGAEELRAQVEQNLRTLLRR